VVVNIVKAQTLSGKNDVLGYQTGLPVLKDLASLQFRPGAFSDHLTSFGGAIGDKRSQTPITELIRAGATASFGTVREPCNFPEKFPDPQRLMINYLHGDSILEAYWKSVSWTTEGLLIGEPLARPFPVVRAELDGTNLTISINRHTQAFIADASRTSNDKTPSGDKPAVSRAGIYDVTHGHPELIGDIVLAPDLENGALVGHLALGKSPAPGLVLGMLPRR